MDDVTEVSQLILHERRSRDRGWWSHMRKCLAVDAAIRLSWFRGSGADFVAASREMAARGDSAAHTLGPPAVDVLGARAVVEVAAAIHMRSELDGVEVDLTSHTRLLYRAERRTGRWVIVSLDPIYERDNLLPSVPGTHLEIDPDALARARPTYRMLTHLLNARGYPIADDLYGDDRPAPVQRLYRSLFDWLGPRADLWPATAARGHQEEPGPGQSVTGQQGDPARENFSLSPDQAEREECECLADHTEGDQQATPQR
ncbi:nuclear transport factor 2 family protein [Streptomyces lunalinharesii]|uniref:SnoaL-like domain-containing protein n=1 Tax=Streptomyces lunalinharesii TaxID=333384 RepID=A0ABN3T253_9ACTN